MRRLCPNMRLSSAPTSCRALKAVELADGRGVFDRRGDLRIVGRKVEVKLRFVAARELAHETDEALSDEAVVEPLHDPKRRRLGANGQIDTVVSSAVRNQRISHELEGDVIHRR